jgi:hypothetical protein
MSAHIALAPEYRPCTVRYTELAPTKFKDFWR